MRVFLSTLFAAAMLLSVGCSSSTEPTPVATSEDEIARYEAMIEEDQQQTEQDATDADEAQ